MRERPTETRAVRRAESLASLALEDVDPRPRRTQLVDPRARSVGRSVVDEQQIDRRRLACVRDAPNERIDVLDLVICRHNYDQLCVLRCQPMSLPYVHRRTAGGSSARSAGVQFGPQCHILPVPPEPNYPDLTAPPRRN